MDFTSLSYIAAFITAIVGFYASDAIRRRNEASATQAITDSAMRLVDAKDKDNQNLRLENLMLKLYIEYLKTGVRLLSIQITRDNKEPEFNPQSLERFTKDNQ